MKIGGAIALSSVPPAPWKNGGGTTRTLAAAPEGAGMDDFLWRVSMAQIHASGDFSAFPGIDRTILLWRGSGVVLQSPQWPEHALTEPLQPFSFRGEDAVACRLLGASAMDLNLMVRRGAASAAMSCHAAAVEIAARCEELLVLCAEGRVRVRVPDGSEIVVACDHFTRIAEAPAGVRVIPEGQGRFVCITLPGRRALPIGAVS